MGILDIRNVNILFNGTANNGEFGDLDDGNGVYIWADGRTYWEKSGITPP